MKRFANILLVVDVSTDCEAALKRAATLASNNQADLTVCTVVDEIPSDMQFAVTAVTPAELAEIAVAERHDLLKEIVEGIEADGLSVSVRVRMGKPFLEIIRQVLECDHDLIIKNAECAVGLKESLFGSTDMHLMRKCPCPVWLVKSAENRTYRRILAAVDQDRENATQDALNRQLIEMATSLALSELSELHIVHAWHLMAERYLRSMGSGYTDADVDAIATKEASQRRKWLEEIIQSYGTKSDQDESKFGNPAIHLIKGDPRFVIPTTARDLEVDLVVMGTLARSGIAGFFMGNTAESILNQIDCSVLTVKPPGFVSPVVA